MGNPIPSTTIPRGQDFGVSFIARNAAAEIIDNPIDFKVFSDPPGIDFVTDKNGQVRGTGNKPGVYGVFVAFGSAVSNPTYVEVTQDKRVASIEVVLK